MIRRVVCIVEGHGEIRAVPILIRRIARECDPPRYDMEIPQPIRKPANQLVRSGELEREVQLAALEAGPSGAVLILLDCDLLQDCPAQLGPEYLRRAQGARPDVPMCMVLARREFEAWFLAAAESLRGQRGLADNLEPPDEPELLKGPKEWLSERMGHHRGYSPTLDQAALAQMFDMNLARQRSRSFAKFYSDVEKLLTMP